MSNMDAPFSKKVEMSLLFGQSLEIQTLYYQSFPDDYSFNPSKYYLLPKNWIDKYKNLFNYNLYKPNINDYSDYNSFKFKMLADSASEIKNSDFSNNSRNNEIPPIEKHSIKNHNCQIEYPIDFFPVREEIFKNLNFIPNEYLYELIIGNNNIFVIDNKSKKNIFVCSLNFDKEDLDDFIANVNYIIIYDNPNIFKKEMKNHISKKGFEKYCKEKKLNLNLNEIQDIKDREDKVGIFLPINNINEETPGEFILEYHSEEIKVNNSNNSHNNMNKININQSTARTNVNFVNLSIGEFRQNYQNNQKNNLNPANNIDNNNQNFNNQNINNENNNKLYNNILKSDVKPFYFNNNKQNDKVFTNNIENPINKINNRMNPMNQDSNQNNNLNQNYNPSNNFVQGQYANQNNSFGNLGNIILCCPGDIYYKIRNTNIQKSYFDYGNNDNNNYNNNNNIQFINYPQINIEHFENNNRCNNQNNFPNNPNFYNNNGQFDNNNRYNQNNFPNNQNFYNNNNNFMQQNINNNNYNNRNDNMNQNNFLYNNNMNQNNIIDNNRNNNMNQNNFIDNNINNNMNQNNFIDNNINNNMNQNNFIDFNGNNNMNQNIFVDNSGNNNMNQNNVIDSNKNNNMNQINYVDNNINNNMNQNNNINNYKNQTSNISYHENDNINSMNNNKFMGKNPFLNSDANINPQIQSSNI